MIRIDIPYRTDDVKSVNFDMMPSDLIHAVMDTRRQYPDILNEDMELPDPKFHFDRLFEQLFRCRVEYNDFRGIKSIIWDNDLDYTWFKLKWA